MNQSKENIDTKGAEKTGVVPTFLVAIEQYSGRMNALSTIISL